MNAPTRVVLSAISTVLFIFAACMLAATLALGWLYGTQRSEEGFVESSDVSMSTDGYAITSADMDLGSLPEEWIPTNVVGKFQVRVQSESGSPLFVGVGPSREVGDFLADVEYAEVTRFGNRERLSYTEHAGSAIPQPPEELDFWTVSTEGSGPQTLNWEPESGEWTLVVMNSDAAPGLDISASLGVNTPWIPIGMWVLGVLTILVGAGAVVIAAIASKQARTVDTSDEGTPEHASVSN